MKRGKKICGELKKIRRRIADENGIKLDIPECTYEGECRGTCPRCEWEVKYLEKTLFERLKLGKIATISGLALGLSACNGGGGIDPDIQVIGEIPYTDTENVPPPPPEPEFPEGMDELGIITGEAEEEISADEIFVVPEKDPEFPGGEQALYDFLRKNIRYPQAAKDSNIQGKVYVTFVVEKDGTITNLKVLRDIGGGCGEEALRVLRMMPQWKPGMQLGKAVRVQYNLPITFKTEE